MRTKYARHLDANPRYMDSQATVLTTTLRKPLSADKSICCIKQIVNREKNIGCFRPFNITAYLSVVMNKLFKAQNS